MSDVFGWIILGLFAGALGKLIMPGKDPGGCVITILLGIAGALLAGYLGRISGYYGQGETAGFFAATFGAVLILILYRLIIRPKKND